MWREIGGSFEDGVCFVNSVPSVLMKRQQDMLLLAWVTINLCCAKDSFILLLCIMKASYILRRKLELFAFLFVSYWATCVDRLLPPAATIISECTSSNSSRSSIGGLERWLGLRALTALLEDLGSVPSIHTVAHNCLTPVPGNPTPSPRYTCRQKQQCT